MGRTAKELGIKVDHVRKFTAPDGTEFDHYSKAMAYTNRSHREQRVIDFCIEHRASDETLAFIRRHMEALSKII